MVIGASPQPPYLRFSSPGKALFHHPARLATNHLPSGATYSIYLLLYASGRFVISFWSSYNIVAFDLYQAQVISLAALLFGTPLLLVRLRRAATQSPGRDLTYSGALFRTAGSRTGRPAYRSSPRTQARRRVPPRAEARLQYPR